MLKLGGVDEPLAIAERQGPGLHYIHISQPYLFLLSFAVYSLIWSNIFCIFFFFLQKLALSVEKIFRPYEGVTVFLQHFIQPYSLRHVGTLLLVTEEEQAQVLRMCFQAMWRQTRQGAFHSNWV